MTWQRLTYGTLVAVGLAITGVTIYQGAMRKQVKPVDLIEVVEGVQERWAALQVGTGLVWVVSTNWVPTWAADGSPLRYALPRQSTNAPIAWTNYLAVAGSNAVVSTNLGYGLQLSQTVPLQVGRYVWSAHDTYHVSGFENPVESSTAINGTYRWGGQDVYGVYYTNEPPAPGTLFTYVLVDRGPSGGWQLAAAYGATTSTPPQNWEYEGGVIMYSDAHDPLSYAGVWHDDYYFDPGTVAAVGGVNSNRIRDAAAIVDVPVLNAIGPTVSRSLMVALDASIMALVPEYVDDSLMADGTFDGWFSATSHPSAFPMQTVTGLFARLNIGDGTNRFTRTPARSDPARQAWVYAYTTWWPNGTERALCYTAEAYRAVNYASAWDGTNYTWSVYSNAVEQTIAATNVAATFGDIGWLVTTNDLWERYRVLQALQTTTRSAGWGISTRYVTTYLATSIVYHLDIWQSVTSGALYLLPDPDASYATLLSWTPVPAVPEAPVCWSWDPPYTNSTATVTGMPPAASAVISAGSYLGADNHGHLEAAEYAYEVWSSWLHQIDNRGVNAYIASNATPLQVTNLMPLAARTVQFYSGATSPSNRPYRRVFDVELSSNAVTAASSPVPPDPIEIPEVDICATNTGDYGAVRYAWKEEPGSGQVWVESDYWRWRSAVVTPGTSTTSQVSAGPALIRWQFTRCPNSL